MIILKRNKCVSRKRTKKKKIVEREHEVPIYLHVYIDHKKARTFLLVTNFLSVAVISTYFRVGTCVIIIVKEVHPASRN